MPTCGRGALPKHSRPSLWCWPNLYEHDNPTLYQTASRPSGWWKIDNGGGGQAYFMSPGNLEFGSVQREIPLHVYTNTADSD